MVFKGYEKGAVDYLFKPIDERILSSKVRVFLELYQQKQLLKTAAEELRQYAETQTILLREVNHRVKNNLASIISMLNMRRDHAEAQGQAPFQNLILDLTSCVRGLAAVHGMLSEKSWQPLNLGDFCQRILQGALLGLVPHKRIAIAVAPSELRVLPDQAHHLAFLLNELATNTRKHAASLRDETHVAMEIKTVGDSVVLLYRDDGPGYPEERLNGVVSGASIGFELIKGFVHHNLGGAVRFANDGGAIAEITFKLKQQPAL
jgi:two-component sensor histidine kinase